LKKKQKQNKSAKFTYCAHFRRIEGKSTPHERTVHAEGSENKQHHGEVTCDSFQLNGTITEKVKKLNENSPNEKSLSKKAKSKFATIFAELSLYPTFLRFCLESHS